MVSTPELSTYPPSTSRSFLCLLPIRPSETSMVAAGVSQGKRALIPAAVLSGMSSTVPKATGLARACSVATSSLG